MDTMNNPTTFKKTESFNKTFQNRESEVCITV